MLYLFDANILIRAHEDYYPIDRVPQFWEWLLEQAVTGYVKVPFEIYKEIIPDSRPFKHWIRQKEVGDALILDEEINQDLVDRILSEGYGGLIVDTAVGELGRDPFLLGYALAGPDRVVVTKERSSPTDKGRSEADDSRCVQQSRHRVG